jgi:hypothetical protein
VLLRTLRVKPPDEAFGQGDTPWAAEASLARQAAPYQQGVTPPPEAIGPGPTSLPPGQPMRPPPELGRGDRLGAPISPEAPAIVPLPETPVTPLPQPSAVPAPVPALAATAPASGPVALPPLVTPQDRVPVCRCRPCRALRRLHATRRRSRSRRCRRKCPTAWRRRRRTSCRSRSCR